MSLKNRVNVSFTFHSFFNPAVAVIYRTDKLARSFLALVFQSRVSLHRNVSMLYRFPFALPLYDGPIADAARSIFKDSVSVLHYRVPLARCRRCNL